MQRSMFRCFLMLAVSGLVVGSVGCSGSEKGMVTIEYVLSPTKGLPPGMNSVAILDAKVNEVTDTKWSELAANYVQNLIQESNKRYGANVTVADRKHTATVMKEADLAAAGMIPSENAGQAAKLLDVQGIIMAEINVRVEKYQETGTTVEDIDFWALRHGNIGGGVRTGERIEETRNMTVQTDFKLVDAVNSQNWATCTDMQQRTDKTKVSPFFGSSKTEASMTARDRIIAAAVESGAQKFLSQLIPCPVRYEVAVKSSHNENCAKGVSALRAEMYGEATRLLELAMQEDPQDDKAAFAAGVACEASGRYADAMTYYQKACMLDDDPQYQEARKRLSENINQIRGAG